jgi:hypothetical protein
MTALRVLIGCERFGRVRDAFLARGHDAWSCDLAQDATGSNRHIVGDVRDVMTWGWDLLAVMHPTCTRLCNSGVRWLDDPRCKCPDDAAPDDKAAWPAMSMDDRRAVMQRLLRDGADLFSACINAPIDRVACENPVMHHHAKALIAGYTPAAQTVQPWWFGDPYFKATGLYLRGLPKLTATKKLTPPRKVDEPERHAAWSMVHRASPGPDRAMLRSATFPGVANAMADQWGGFAMVAA